MTAKENVLETIRAFAERLLARGAHRAHDIVFIGRDNTDLVSMNREVIAWYLSAAATI